MSADNGRMGSSPDLGRVLSLEVPLIVVLGERQMRLTDVLALVPGAIIELPKGSEEELQLLVNNKPIATGVAVKVGENFGLRVTYVGDLLARISALAGGAVGAGADGGVAGALAGRDGVGAVMAAAEAAA